MNTCSTPVQQKGEQTPQQTPHQTGNPSICRLPTAPLSPSTAARKLDVERAGAIEASAELGNRRLRAYLAAPPAIRERFDEQQARAIRRDCAVDERVALELVDDPVAQAVANRRALERLIAGGAR